MNDNPSHPTVIIDLINIIFTTITWTLPDLSIIYKVIISTVLITILVFVRVQPQIFASISNLYYVLLLIIPVLLSSIEYLISFNLLAIFSESSSGIFPSLIIPLQAGITFGLVVGFPVALFSTIFETKQEGCVGVPSGCIIQAVFFSPLIIIQVFFPQSFLNTSDFVWIILLVPFYPFLILTDDFVSLGIMAYSTVLFILLVIQLIQFRSVANLVRYLIYKSKQAEFVRKMMN